VLKKTTKAVTKKKVEKLKYLKEKRLYFHNFLRNKYDCIYTKKKKKLLQNIFLLYLYFKFNLLSTYSNSIL
jgi:hypothetical protein